MDIDHFSITDLSRQVNDLLREKNVVAALSLVEREIQTNPRDAFNYALKAFIHSFNSDFAAARTEIKQALSLDPTNPEVLAKCAVSLRVMGRLDLVIELLRRIPFIVGNPGSMGVRFELLYSLMSLSTLQRRLRTITKRNLQNIFDSAEDRKRQGILLAYYGDLENSVNLLKAEIIKNPLNPEVLAVLGAIAIQNSQPLVAEEYLKLVIQLEPNNGEAFFLRGIAHLQGALSYEDYVMAYELLRRCVELLPDHYAAIEQLSAAAMFLHRHKESSQYFNRQLTIKQAKIPIRALSSIGLAVLSHHWTTNIGHYWGLETLVKEIVLGRTHFKAGIAICAMRPANPALLSYFEPYIKFVTDPNETEILQSMPEEDFWSSEYAAIASGSLAMVQRPLAELDEQWTGRPPLLSLRPEHEEQGWKVMQTMGVAPGSWFVSLHARSMGFYEHGSFGSHNEYRNARIENYFDAIKAITSRGGWVVRMGDPSMPKLPPLPNVIDYAHSPMKSDWMDVFLWAKCKFFIGTQSGPQNIPPMFGVPVVMVNMTSIRGLTQFLLRRDVAIPKLYRSTKENRLLSFGESLSEPYASVFTNAATLRHHSIELVENSADEIEAAVEEMFNRLEGRHLLTPEDREDQDKLLAQVPDIKRLGFPQLLGRNFVRKYRNLI